ncbi:unnamed protein product, partial [Amoebophrya sp. A25]|eukprot:GSA25T00020422001.1
MKLILLGKISQPMQGHHLLHHLRCHLLLVLFQHRRRPLPL